MENLKVIKNKTRDQLKNIAGVQGVGIGNNTIRVYIRNDQVIPSLPKTVDGITIETVIVGEIRAL